MKELSALEANLVYAVQQEPGRTLTYYGDVLRTQHTQMTRALERLMRFGYLHREDNRLTISDAFKKQDFEAEIEREEKRQQAQREARANEDRRDRVPEVPKAEPVKSAVAIAMEAAVKKAEKKPKKIKADETKVTCGDVLTLLSDGVRRTAAEIAQHFNMKSGHSVGQLLRLLTGDGSVLKDGTLYQRKPSEALAQAVAPKPDPAKAPDYAHDLSDDELKAAILRLREPFTAQECLSILSRKHQLETVIFMRVFEDVADSGALVAWDGQEFVDPRNDYAPTHKFIVLNKVEAKTAFTILDDYRRMLKEPYSLYDVVSTTRLPPSEVLSYFYDMQYNVENPARMVYEKPPVYLNRKVKREVAMGQFKKLAELDSENIKRFLMEGVKVDVFLKRFNLDPAERKDIIHALVITDIAKHDTENDWLFLHPSATVNLKIADADEIEGVAEVLKTVKDEEQAAAETPMDRMRRAAERFEQSVGAQPEKIGAMPTEEGTAENVEVIERDSIVVPEKESEYIEQLRRIEVTDEFLASIASYYGEEVAQQFKDGRLKFGDVIPDELVKGTPADTAKATCRCGRDHSNDEPVNLEKIAEEAVAQIAEAEDKLIKESALKMLKEGVEDFEIKAGVTLMSSDLAQDLGIDVDSLEHRGGASFEAFVDPSEKQIEHYELFRLVDAKDWDILLECRNAEMTELMFPEDDDEPDQPMQSVWISRRLARSVGIKVPSESDDDAGDTCGDCGAPAGEACICEGVDLCDCDPGETCAMCGDDATFGPDLDEPEMPEIVEHYKSGAGPSGPIGPGFVRMDPPNPRWTLTLQMLEERLRFEHQYTQANQLKDIREYLEK
jgi:predicted nucleic acid-binding Zn ribbon protein